MAKPNNSHSFWYTDEDTVSQVLEVLGEIDLDPCSSIEANKRIGAKQIFTVSDSCLDREWPKVETVYMNNPYSADCGGSTPFVNKFLQQFHKKRFTSGIALVNANPASGWFQTLLNNCTRVCFRKGRIAFDEDLKAVSHKRDLTEKEQEFVEEHGFIKTGTSPRYDNAIFLFSDSTKTQRLFDEVFASVGQVLKKA